MTASSLFSAGERTWTTPQAHSESAYAFLDRSARLPCQRVRKLLDDWYSHLPIEARASIRTRFGDRDPGPHLGALWELYLYETLRRLDFEVDLDIGRENPEHPRPDFLLTDGAVSFYLEATAALGASVLGDQRSQALAADFREAIERVKTPNFMLGVELAACGTNSPGRRDVTEPVQRWLDGLDPDEVIAERSRTGEVPRKTLSFDGWEAELDVIPVLPENRADPDHRMIGSYSEGIGSLDDATPLRRKLKRKAGRYGALDLPFAVALLCAGDFADDPDIADALLGNSAVEYEPRTLRARWVRAHDGFWHGPHGPQNTSVAAVVTIPQLSCMAIAAVEPTVWLNPWASAPLPADLPWRTQVIATDGRISTRAASKSPGQLFGLPERWPFQE